MHILKVIGIVLLLVVVGALAVAWYLMRPIIHFDESQIPRDLITSQFIDFDRVYMVSKFRSGAGHDFSSHWSTRKIIFDIIPIS